MDLNGINNMDPGIIVEQSCTPNNIIVNPLNNGVNTIVNDLCAKLVLIKSNLYRYLNILNV